MAKVNQTGDGSNFVKIGAVRREGSVIVHQNIAAGVAPSYVQLEIDPDSKQQFPKAEVERRAMRGGIVLTASCLISISAIFADYVGILSHFGMPPLITTIASAAIGIAGGLISRINGDSEFLVWRLRRPKQPHEPRSIGLQRYLKLDDAGNYLISSCTASCIYPKCDGKIDVRTFPHVRNTVMDLRGCVREQTMPILILSTATGLLRQKTWIGASPTHQTIPQAIDDNFVSSSLAG